MSIFVVRGENRRSKRKRDKVNSRGGVESGGTNLRKETRYFLFRNKNKEKQPR